MFLTTLLPDNGRAEACMGVLSVLRVYCAAGALSAPRATGRDDNAGRRRVTFAGRAERGARAPVDLPVFRGGGGVLPGVDLDSNATLLDLMDESDGAYDRYRGKPSEAS